MYVLCVMQGAGYEGIAVENGLVPVGRVDISSQDVEHPSEFMQFDSVYGAKEPSKRVIVFQQNE